MNASTHAPGDDPTSNAWSAYQEQLNDALATSMSSSAFFQEQ
jgi:hypothetical protein